MTLYLYLYRGLSHQLVHSSVCPKLSIRPSVHPSIYPFVCLSIHPSVCSSLGPDGPVLSVLQFACRSVPQSVLRSSVRYQSIRPSVSLSVRSPTFKIPFDTQSVVISTGHLR